MRSRSSLRSLVSRIFRVRSAAFQEGAAAAAHRDFKAVARSPVDELGGDVGAVDFGSRNADIGFPVTVRRLGVGCARCRVGQAGRGDKAGGEACALGDVEDRVGAVALEARAIVESGGAGNAQRAGICFHAAHHGRCRGSRVGNLGVIVVGLGQGGIGQLVHGQLVVLAVAAALLAGIDAGSRDGRDAHAVADKQDHVLGGPDAAGGDLRVDGGLGLHVIAVGRLLRHGRFARERRNGQATGSTLSVVAGALVQAAAIRAMAGRAARDLRMVASGGIRLFCVVKGLCDGFRT